jgi:hypothetical protein
LEEDTKQSKFDQMKSISNHKKVEDKRPSIFAKPQDPGSSGPSILQQLDRLAMGGVPIGRDSRQRLMIMQGIEIGDI